MKITMETDYAVRIVYCLACSGGVMDAKEICGEVGVTFRFALKILRKLCMHGIAKSFRGVNGGYSLLMAPAEITLLNVFEAIDGEVAVSKCLAHDELCTWTPEKNDCPFHKEFVDLNDLIKKKLASVSFDPAVREEK